MAQLKINPAPAREFLKALYGPFFSQAQGTAYLEVRGKREGEGMTFRRFYPNPEALLNDMASWKPGLNYWVGVALRNDSKGGAKINLLALTAAFADVDVGTAGHKNASTYETKAEALAAIEAFPLRPTTLIDSGGGYQCYWLFREPVSLLKDEIPMVEGITRGLSLALGGDVAASDAARILRLPGTWNMKLQGQPRPVEVVWCESERVYELAALAKYEDKARRQKQEPRHDPQGGTAAGPGGDFSAYAQRAFADELAKLARTPEGGRNAQLNQSAFALGQLVGAGVLERGSVEAGLSGAAAVIGLGEAETRATIKSGLDRGISEPRTLPEKAPPGGGVPKQGASQGGGHQAGQGEPGVKEIWWVGHTYFVHRGRLSLKTFDRKGEPATPAALANFQARITEEIFRDDGLRRSKEFQITGSLETGQALSPALVPAEKYDSLTWIKREWGAAASVAPGRSLGPHLGAAIQAHSRGFKRRTVYAHSGWRKIGGAWRFLHGAGGIGTGELVEVDLGENLGNYRLSEPGGIEAAQASLRFLEVAPWEITAPLLACAYLAPFADLLKIDFSLWLYGPTGSMKSTLAALALCHFGNFDRLTLPGSWFSTVNSLERLCHALKDHLIVIDDFVPAASAKDFHGMSEKAGRLLYQVGNRSSRGRLAPDLSARPNYYPRGLIISTGEVLLPGQRQSATARYMGVELDPKKTPVDKARLTAAQGEAPLYAGAMAAYLADLAPRLDEVQGNLRAVFEEYRGDFQYSGDSRNGGHARIPEVLSWLAVGFKFFLNFQVSMGAISQDEDYQMFNKAWNVFEALGKAHSR
ncbi:MAG: DUF927 domain-containing protein, partial [Syntrophobacterales bacterium]|nr:DUF927 domain-containing protein [Syntrophobacterales bacterium]